MFFRIIRSELGQAREDLRNALTGKVAGTFPLIIPLARPSSEAGRLLQDEVETAVLDEYSAGRGVNIAYVAEEDEFPGLIAAVSSQMAGVMNGEVPASTVICVNGDRSKIWILRGPPVSEATEYLEYLHQLCHVMGNDGRPMSFATGGPRSSLENMAAVSSIIGLLLSIIK